MTRRDRTATPCTSARPGPRRRRRRKFRSRSAAGPSRLRSEGDGGYRAESSGGFPRPPSGRSRRPAASILLRERRGIQPGAQRANPPRRRQREAEPRHGLPGPMLLEPASRRFDLSTVQRVSRSCPAPYQAPEGKSIFRRVRWRIGSNVTPRFVAEGRRMRRPYRKWRVPLVLVLLAACGALGRSKGRGWRNFYPFQREYVSLLLSFLPDERVRLPFLTT